MGFSLNPFMPQLYVYSFFCLSFLSFIFLNIHFFIVIIIIIIIIFHVYVFSTCADLAEKRIRFPQCLSLVLCLDFRIFYFCTVELRDLVNLKYIKKIGLVLKGLSLNYLYFYDLKFNA